MVDILFWLNIYYENLLLEIYISKLFFWNFAI